MDGEITPASNQTESIDYAAFGRESLVNTLVGQIDSSLRDDSANIEPSLVVGVLGEWGSGKSTILQALNDHYEKAIENSCGDVTLPVFFNPWRFESEVHLIVPLLKTAQACVKKYLDKHADKAGPSFKTSVVRLGQTAIALATALKGKVSIPFLGELDFNLQDALDREARYLEKNNEAEGLSVDFDSIYFNLHNQIEQITARDDGAGAKLNLLFLIDDLDRCLPEKAVQVMESVKLFLDARGCAFVLALDEEVVERGIVHRYRDYLFQGENKNGTEGTEKTSTQLPITGAEYLEKIIQLPIHLPRPDDRGIRQFLLERFPDLFVEKDKQNASELNERGSEKPDDKSALLDLFVKAIPPIPRKHVRAASLLQFIQKLTDKINLDTFTLARLVILQLFAPELYRHGRRNPAFLFTMEQWAKQNRQDWSSPTRVSRLLIETRDNLKSLVEKEESNQGASGDILTYERHEVILECIATCTRNRGEFDPRDVIDPDRPSDDNITRYISCIEERKTGTRRAIFEQEMPEASINQEDSFIQQLLSQQEDAWLNAIQQSEINEGEVMPQSVFNKLLEQLASFPGDAWLERVAPVLTHGQRRALAEKFDADYQQTKTIVENPPLGQTEDNARAGRILGWLGDDRDGIRLDDDGLPDIDWLVIEAPKIAYSLNENKGELKIDKKGSLELNYDYKIARYPVTWGQFQAFVDHADGYHNDAWWQDLECGDAERNLEKAEWSIPNHPRETVNWFQCMAFCRWLNRVKNPGDDQVISLPTEWEWQYAASGSDIEKHRYPSGATYQAGYANINETRTNAGSSFLGRTTAVGLYPHGPTGLADTSGNVLEWCLNQVEDKKIDDISIVGAAARALRGGSWVNGPVDASAALRGGNHPGLRSDGGGFRVVCVPAQSRNTDH